MKIINIPQPDNAVAYKKTGYDLNPIGITIHNTANVASARNEIEYMHVSDDYRSFHFAVDDNEIVQGESLKRNTWHAGDGNTGVGNRQTISIEICLSYVNEYTYHGSEEVREKYWRDHFRIRFEKAQENAAELVAKLLHDYGWGFAPSRIYKHQDFDYGNKHCPHRTLDMYGWGYFLTLVEKKYSEMEEKNKENKPMTKEEKYAFEELEEQVEDLAKSIEDLTEKYTKAKARIKDLETQAIPKWGYIDGNMPEWMKPTIQKLVKKGYLKGENGNLLMSYLFARVLVVLDRAKVFDD